MNSQERSVVKGVTLVELLIVLAITLIIGAITIPLSSNFLARNAIRNKTNEIVVSLKIAQINSMSGKGGSTWGVNVDTNNITLFKGDSFATRDTTQDRKYSVPSSVQISQFEVVFAKNSGNPDSTQDITLQNNFETKHILVNEIGNVDLI